MGRLRVPLDLGNSGVGGAFPDHPACLSVQTIYFPGVDSGFLDRSNVAVKPDLQCLISRSSLIAVVTNILSPNTTGLEWPIPGIGIFHSTFCAVSTFH